MLSQTKNQSEIEAMRQGGSILAKGLRLMAEAAVVGVSTKKLSLLAERHIEKANAKPAFLNYPGSGGVQPFPEVACISVNDAVVHGVPSEKYVLKDGDIVSLDLGVSYKGMIVDGAITIIVGKGTPETINLLEQTKKSLFAGLKKVHDGCMTGDIGASIEQILKENKLGIVRDLVGHGVGYSVHEDPNIPNFGRRGSGTELTKGMTVAIEPMATLGKHEIYIDCDGWTVRTKDGSLAAHFEHTVLVTDKGCEILTVER